MNFSRTNKKIILIDGGLGTTLQEYGFAILNDPLWSGKILVEQPEQLAKVHRAFVQTKCDFITTATYQVSVENLIKECQLTFEQAEEILSNSVRIARNVIEEEKAQCYVAASIGPYGAILSDGSEFNGWYTNSLTLEQLKDWHRPRLAILARSEPDLIAFETIPSKKEAEALAELLKEFPNVKAWLSFNCQRIILNLIMMMTFLPHDIRVFFGQNDQLTAHGEAIEEAITSVYLKSPDQIIAVGMNCVHPGTVIPLIKRLSNINRDFIAYPNAGVIWNDAKKQFDSQGQSIVPYIRSYIDAGIKYIGGCCHVNPTEIHAIRDIIDESISLK